LYPTSEKVDEKEQLEKLSKYDSTTLLRLAEGGNKFAKVVLQKRL
jgi:hypothetical protein